MSEHKSDCAVHNAPAYEPGPCDCGADEKFGLYSNEWIADQQNKIAELLEALKLTEQSEEEWANCPECHEALSWPELCEHCFTRADQARLARRNALAKHEGTE